MDSHLDEHIHTHTHTYTCRHSSPTSIQLGYSITQTEVIKPLIACPHQLPGWLPSLTP